MRKTQNEHKTKPKPGDYAKFLAETVLPYLRMYKPHFFGKNLPPKIGVRLIHGVKN
jgi:hypothetical protein